MHFKLLLAAVGICLMPLHAVYGIRRGLKEIFRWVHVDYKFPDNASRKNAIESGSFIPQNCLITGLEIWRKKLFLTTPRLKPGVPSTLNYIDVEGYQEDNTPQLIPYPNWEVNAMDTRERGIQLNSVVSVKIDPCLRLWVLDNGVINKMTNNHIKRPPSLVIFSLVNSSPVHTYTLKPEEYEWPRSNFWNMAVDVSSDSCSNAFAYLADSGDPGILVYNLQRKSAHRVTNNYFHFNPIDSIITISTSYSKKNYQRTEGIFGMALGTQDSEGHRRLLFHPLFSTLEFGVSTENLQNKSYAANNVPGFYVAGDRGPGSQSAGSFIDPATGMFFYTLISRNGIACWNTMTGEKLLPSNQGIIAENDTDMVYPNDVKVDKMGNLWVLSNRMNDFIFESPNHNEDVVMMRVFMAPVSQVIRGTICDDLQ